MNFGIALGSNLGDRLAHLRSAIAGMLRTLAGARLHAVAPLYETAPVDCPDGSGSFYNTVVEIEAEIEPLALLHELRRIEAELGRVNAHEHHAPRTVDLDLLYADGVAMGHPELTLPHPRLHRRRFVLQPLADIRPRLVLPGQTRNMAALLAALDSTEPPLRLVMRDWVAIAD
jgi:2-amino-4-hydroxy-6-hydroxymethyldihydropteridine diphosphokinase